MLDLLYSGTQLHLYINHTDINVSSLCSSPNSQKLHTLIAKLKRWIKILELKTKSLQK